MFALEPDPPAVTLDVELAEVEAEGHDAAVAGDAGGHGLVEGLEDVRLSILGDADAVVRDGEEGVGIIRPDAEGDVAAGGGGT